MKRNNPRHAVYGSLALDISSDTQSFETNVIDYEMLKETYGYGGTYARHARLSSAQLIAQNLRRLCRYGASVYDELRDELLEGSARGVAFQRFTPGQALASFCVLTAVTCLIAFAGA